MKPGDQIVVVVNGNARSAHVIPTPQLRMALQHGFWFKLDNPRPKSDEIADLAANFSDEGVLWARGVDNDTIAALQATFALSDYNNT